VIGRALQVVCFGRRAGTLLDDPEGLAFVYEAAWISDGQPPLSQSLPLDGSFGVSEATAFFGGLLPEGTPREILARQLGVSVANDFGLLEHLGGDTAGAISLLVPGASPSAHRADDIDWLDEEPLGTLIEELPARPMHADADGEWRLSLAGAQDKLPVVVGADGRVGLTRGRSPSTHILKTPIDRLPDTVANEAFCLDLGQRLGVTTVRASPRRAGGRECLLVARYDRRHTEAGVRRLHQEDFCQALGIPTHRKYQSEGGPSLEEGFGLLRAAVAVPARDAPRMLDYLGLSFLVANHDAHGKNYSLLYGPGAARASLAPAYDVLCTIVYDKVKPMSRKMAMKIGGEYRPDYVRSRHLDRLLTDAGLGAAPSRRRLRALATSAPRAAAAARAALAEDGWDSPTLAAIEHIVGQRAQWLLEIAAPAAAPARRSTAA